MSANRYILGPDDVRRTPAEHAVAFPPAPQGPVTKSPPPAQSLQPDSAPGAAPNEKPIRGAKAK